MDISLQSSQCSSSSTPRKMFTSWDRYSSVHAIWYPSIYPIYIQISKHVIYVKWRLFFWNRSLNRMIMSMDKGPSILFVSPNECYPLRIYLLCCRKIVEVAGHLELQVGKMIFKLSVKYTWNCQQRHLWQIHPGDC